MSNGFELKEIKSIKDFVQLIENDKVRKVEQIMKISTLEEYKRKKENLCDGSNHHDPSDQWPWIEAFQIAEEKGILEKLSK